MCEREMLLEEHRCLSLWGSPPRCLAYLPPDDSCLCGEPPHCNTALEDEPTPPGQGASLFADVYLRQGRLDHVVQLMGYHPKYLEAFLRLHYKLFTEDGPLPLPDRHYIAIMAASRHGCAYLASAHMREFSVCGGSLGWLRGRSHAPRKLQALDELNAVMAHRPWMLEPLHFKSLLSGAAEVRWSQAEVMQAVIIMAHVHALCSFVFGLGVTPEVDDPQGVTYEGSVARTDEDSTDSSSRNGAGKIAEDATRCPLDIPSLVRYMRHVTELPDDSAEEQLQQFESARHQPQAGADPGHEVLPAGLHLSSGCETYDASLSRFVKDADFTYKDFYSSNGTRDASEKGRTLRSQDYSWDGEGYIVCDDLYPGIGQCLDAKFRITESLTYNRMGDVLNVDTTAFRQALLLYTHCVYGIRHDDYNYSKMNLLLKKPLKSYAKTVVCYPERLTSSDHEAFIPGLKFSEKVHIQLMLLESRLKAELLYALRQLATLRR